MKKSKVCVDVCKKESQDRSQRKIAVNPNAMSLFRRNNLQEVLQEKQKSRVKFHEEASNPAGHSVF